MDQMFPRPIWAHRARRERAPITEDVVVDAALGLLDEEGSDAVTMRRVAQRLGVTAPTVYWHIDSRDGLFDRLFDRLCGEVIRPFEGTWQERLLALATSIRAVMARHRGAARIAIGRFPLGPNGLLVTEAALAALSEVVATDEDAAHAAFLFFSYVTAFSFQETISPSYEPATSRADAMARIGQYLSGLPADRYPHLTRAAWALAGPGLDRRFIFGLNQILSGLAVTSKTNAAGGAPTRQNS